MQVMYLKPKAYIISPTNSLTFLKTEECRAIKQNFTSFMGVYYHPRHAISRELSPQLGLIRQTTPKYKKIEKIKNHR